MYTNEHNKQGRITSTCNKDLKNNNKVVQYSRLYKFFQEEQTIERIFLINFDNFFSFSTS